MIGHTGNIEAAKKTVQAVDYYVKKIYEAAIKIGAVLIITADHGNIEYMFNPETGEKITEHTNNRVPFILISKKFKKSIKLKKNGVLGDVAPTILKIFGINKPKEMTRKGLI